MSSTAKEIATYSDKALLFLDQPYIVTLFDKLIFGLSTPGIKIDTTLEAEMTNKTNQMNKKEKNISY